MMVLRRRGKRIRDILQAAKHTPPPDAAKDTPPDETYHTTDWTQPLPHIPRGYAQLRANLGNGWEDLGPPQRISAPPAEPGRPLIHPDTARALTDSLTSATEAMSTLLTAVQDAGAALTNALDSIAEAISEALPPEEPPQQPTTSPTRAHTHSADLPQLADLWRAISIGWGDQVLNEQGPALTELLWRAEDIHQFMTAQDLMMRRRPVKLPGGDVVVLHSANLQHATEDRYYRVSIRYFFVES
jgi:hypothetical protein